MGKAVFNYVTSRKKDKKGIFTSHFRKITFTCENIKQIGNQVKKLISAKNTCHQQANSKSIASQQQVNSNRKLRKIAKLKENCRNCEKLWGKLQKNCEKIAKNCAKL